jgi:hypothetical protein
MKTRDQAEAGVDPTKTVQLGDAYRLGMASRDASGDREVAASPSAYAASPSTERLPLDGQRRKAESALNSALIELKTAAAAVIDRIRAGEHLPKSELDREWKARIEALEARRQLERLQPRKVV